MIEPARPRDERARLASLHALDVLYSPAEDRFDRITRLACRLLDAPIALVSLVDAECQWFKSVQGLEASETPRSVSFCAHAILSDETLVVPDTRLDPRFADNPLVTGEPFVRFYAGHPVTAPDGARLGTLCVIDRRPRTLEPSAVEALRDLAGWASNELRVAALSKGQQELLAEREALRRKTLVDSLTQVWNHRAILDVLRRELYRASRQRVSTGLLLVDVDGFKHINESHDHVAGDRALRSVAQSLRSGVRLYDAVGRHGGDEFLIVLVDCDRATTADIANRVRTRVEEAGIETPVGPMPVTVSVGAVTCDGSSSTDADHLIADAARALARAKAAGRNQVVVDSPGI
jgi:diguanylate cyclase (GGDEF)-like protein